MKTFQQFLLEKTAAARHEEAGDFHPAPAPSLREAPQEEVDPDKFISSLFGDNPARDAYSKLMSGFKSDFSEFLEEARGLTFKNYNEEVTGKEMFETGEYGERWGLQQFFEQLASARRRDDVRLYKDSGEEARALLDKWWDGLVGFAKKRETVKKEARNWARKKFHKESLKLGITDSAYKDALGVLGNYTSSSKKRLPKEVWDALRAITVKESALPAYVWRGIFYDGAKIKDREAFLKKWAPGSKPNVSQAKATSWSASRGTAIQFMTSQDFIKDFAGGYHVLLKWKVDPKLVIADLRNMPDLPFWNQQELIVSPEARDYEVDTIIPAEPGKKWDEQEYEKMARKDAVPGGGGWGMRQDEFMGRYYFQTAKADIKPGLKEMLRDSRGMTVAEAKDKLDFRFKKVWRDQDPGMSLALALGTKFVTDADYGAELHPAELVSRNSASAKLSLGGNFFGVYGSKREGRSSESSPEISKALEQSSHRLVSDTLRVVAEPGAVTTLTIQRPKEFTAEFVDHWGGGKPNEENERKAEEALRKFRAEQDTYMKEWEERVKAAAKGTELMVVFA
jgi:hypothetical protein